MGIISKWLDNRHAYKMRKLDIAREEQARINSKNDESERYKKAKTRFRLVGEFTESWANTMHGRKDNKYKMYHQLFENEFGERKHEVHVSEKRFLSQTPYENEQLYISVIYPWLQGAYVDDDRIKTYAQAGHDELAGRLKK